MRKRNKLRVDERVIVVRKRLWVDCVEISEECEIIRANGTSAYAAPVSELKHDNPFTYKINQKDFRGSNTMFSFKVYRSIEDYEKSKKDAEELSNLQSYIRANIKDMPLNAVRKIAAMIKRGELDG